MYIQVAGTAVNSKCSVVTVSIDVHVYCAVVIFALVLNFIFVCFKKIFIHYHTHKNRGKLNLNQE